ncbi:ABC transporter ATP-binding protein [Clostridium grantii]|uniref:ABC-2 type transport system ATP-binding protein n=1 Tax=Clostridium grantii DSM 8605 TaxID=1121316 RepID=A0A1M5QE58_9CLOT|nr:ABC transporter ATP-binding protein [Clostridium grantii]SHH12332.1 ABC-2 type transport system ATP-binding protein [Clostridium grantii DSM 8605]
MFVLEVKNVNKHLGKREIIKDLSFSVKKGEIFGFLGPNGAGKTTTIRMLVGLIAPNSGSICIMGHNIKTERELALSKVGAVVENPELYTYLSGKENLMQVARIRKISKEKVDEVIELVQLTDRINDKVKKYSLGMKQRLGLALSLLSEPALLILDEPTNGLDPSGILDFREIVQKAAKETGTAVFVSSHILSEVQQLCDTVAFINKGVIQSVESIKNNNEVKSASVTLITREIEETMELLKTLSVVEDFSSKDNIFSLKIKEKSVSELIFELAKNHIHIEEIFKNHKELEERYMQLVEGGIR